MKKIIIITLLSFLLLFSGCFSNKQETQNKQETNNQNLPIATDNDVLDSSQTTIDEDLNDIEATISELDDFEELGEESFDVSLE